MPLFVYIHVRLLFDEDIVCIILLHLELHNLFHFYCYYHHCSSNARTLLHILFIYDGQKYINSLSYMVTSRLLQFHIRRFLLLYAAQFFLLSGIPISLAPNSLRQCWMQNGDISSWNFSSLYCDQFKEATGLIFLFMSQFFFVLYSAYLLQRSAWFEGLVPHNSPTSKWKRKKKENKPCFRCILDLVCFQKFWLGENYFEVCKYFLSFLSIFTRHPFF